MLLFASSLQQLETMLAEIGSEAQSVGLRLHPDKTKILHNMRGRRPTQQPEHTWVNGQQIEVLPYTSSQKYLGAAFTFQQPTRQTMNLGRSSWIEHSLWKSCDFCNLVATN